jgi:hypothetical protein
MNFTFANFAHIDAEMVLNLIENGEWERAFDRAQVLIGSIEGAMAELGIEPTQWTIHDTTPVA